jgi:hypothetical protein
MCYSQALSVWLALASWVTVAWLTLTNRRGSQRAVPPYLGPIAFYAVMETLQALQYSMLDRCGEWPNYLSTVVAHALVVVQPCLWNVYRLANARKLIGRALSTGDFEAAARGREAAAVFAAAIGMSFVWAACFSLRLLPFDLLPPTRTVTYSVLRNDEIMVGPRVCTQTGPRHLTWTLPYQSKNGLEANLFAYLLLWFYPALYEPQGVVRCACWITQVLVVVSTAGSIHELPTTWCALSVPIILTGICVDVCNAVRLPQRIARCYRSWRRSLGVAACEPEGSGDHEA